jgi:hypothetical protein
MRIENRELPLELMKASFRIHVLRTEVGERSCYCL